MIISIDYLTLNKLKELKFKIIIIFYNYYNVILSLFNINRLIIWGTLFTDHLDQFFSIIDNATLAASAAKGHK